MITGPAASPSVQTTPRGLVPAAGLATIDGAAPPTVPANPPSPGIDRITLTPAARLDLLMAGAEARLRDMDALLEDVSAPVQDPAPIGAHVMTHLVPVAHAAATAVVKATESATAAIATGKSLPGQAERSTALIAHAAASLQVAILRLTHTPAPAGTTLDETTTAFARDDNRGRHAAPTGQPAQGDGGGQAGRIGIDRPDPLAVAAALETMQAIMTRLADRRTGLPASGTSASRSAGPTAPASPAQGRKPARPPWPVLFCLLVGLVLVGRMDLGPMRHAATLLAVLMALLWCGRWLVRRHRHDRRWHGTR